MKLGNKKEPKVVGKVRQSQAITTFGIGSMVDFINHTVMVRGLDAWDWYQDENFQIRNASLENLLGVSYFVKPKISVKDFAWQEDKPDIPAEVFPKWLYCTQCQSLQKATPRNFVKGKFKCFSQNCQGNSLLVPSRFVLVCPNGHIEDFPYSWWVHEAQGKVCNCENPSSFRMYYVGNKTDMDSLFIECQSCGEKRSMKGASARFAFSKFPCSGNRPWLDDSVECHAGDEKKFMQMRIRNESSVYFPCTVSALSIPPWSSKVAKELIKYIELLKGMVEINEDLKQGIVNKAKGKPEFSHIEESEIRSILEKLINCRNEKETLPEIMKDEYSAILSAASISENDDLVCHDEEVSAEYTHIIDRVISIDRLTEVTAMVGFSRLTANQGIDDKNLVPISRIKKDWLPGIEQKGEGIFIKFNQQILDKWSEKYGKRYKEMGERLNQSIFRNDRFSPQYVFLHTFAHLFIRELSNLCGYSSASIKERIYSTYQGDSKIMSGILIYTSTSDSDGSLGGLTEQAKPNNFNRLLKSLHERGKWCSSDPVCYNSKEQGFMSLNYAACFACTLLPETSCEFKNALLDRCSVCGKPDDEELGLLNWRKPC